MRCGGSPADDAFRKKERLPDGLPHIIDCGGTEVCGQHGFDIA
jgi:hypothetical protein